VPVRIRVQVSGLGAQGLGFRVEGSGFGVWGSWVWRYLADRGLVLRNVHPAVLSHLEVKRETAVLSSD